MAIAGSSCYRLAGDLTAKCDSPPFDNSAVDGYGRRIEDLQTGKLRFAGEIRAGDDGSRTVESGQTVRILTGAPTPTSIAAVSMQEDCDDSGETIVFREPATVGENIRRAGSDFKAGDVLIRRGTLMSPPLVGLALSGGDRKSTV